MLEFARLPLSERNPYFDEVADRLVRGQNDLQALPRLRAVREHSLPLPVLLEAIVHQLGERAVHSFT